MINKNSKKWVRRLLTRRYDIEDNISIKFSDPLEWIRFCNELISAIIVPLFPEGEKIVDYKGRDIIDDKESEVLRIDGVLCSPDGDEPFYLTLNTRFEEFRGKHHIIYQANKCSFNIWDGLPAEQIFRAIPIKISKFRFGIEKFRSNHISSFIGFIPTVTERLWGDLTPEGGTILIKAEGLKTNNDVPFLDDGVIYKLNELIIKSNGKSILIK